MKGFFVAMFAIVIGLLVTVLVQGSDFMLLQFFSPKYEQVRRDTFEQSKAYRQGMVQELENMRFQYLQSSEDQRSALASIIRHRAADVDRSTLTPELRAFLSSLY